MLVTLTLGGKAVETRDVPAKNLQIEGYFEGLINDMLEQNEDVIDLTKQTPQFVITGDERPPKKIVRH